MSKKKITDNEEVKDSIPQILVKDLSSLNKSLSVNKLNPLERVMAVNLLLNENAFYCQYRIDLDEGEICNGRKYFIADFYLPDIKAVIETDGKVHETPENIVKDRYRNNFLAGKGYRIFHFTWEDVMGNTDGYDPLAHITDLEVFIEEEKAEHYFEMDKQFKEMEESEKKDVKNNDWQQHL